MTMPASKYSNGVEENALMGLKQCNEGGCARALDVSVHRNLLCPEAVPEGS